MQDLLGLQFQNHPPSFYEIGWRPSLIQDILLHLLLSIFYSSDMALSKFIYSKLEIQYTQSCNWRDWQQRRVIKFILVHWHLDVTSSLLSPLSPSTSLEQIEGASLKEHTADMQTTLHYVLKDSPHPQLPLAFGFVNVNSVLQKIKDYVLGNAF